MGARATGGGAAGALVGQCGRRPRQFGGYGECVLCSPRVNSVVRSHSSSFLAPSREFVHHRPPNDDDVECVAPANEPHHADARQPQLRHHVRLERCGCVVVWSFDRFDRFGSFDEHSLAYLIGTFLFCLIVGLLDLWMCSVVSVPPQVCSNVQPIRGEERRRHKK